MIFVIKELSLYAVASLAALTVDAGLLWILVSYLSVNYLLAATLSFLFGAAVAYLISVKLVFAHRRLGNARKKEFLGFVVLGLPGSALNAGVISVTVKYLGIYYLWAKAVAAVTTFSWTFFARRQILFFRK